MPPHRNRLTILERSYRTHFDQYEKLTIERPVASNLLEKFKQKGKIATGIQGYQDWKKAKKLKELSEVLQEDAKNITKYYLDEIEHLLKNLKKYHNKALQGPIKSFLVYLKKINQKNKKNSYKIYDNINISDQMQKKFQEMSNILEQMDTAHISRKELAGNTALIGTVGTLTAASVPTAITATVGAVATASTGTAISSLSGAAATNATLAWLGGGSIASGGGGVAAGSVVLGGIQIGATGGISLLVAGLLFSSIASNKLTKSTKEVAKMAIHIKKLEALWPILGGQIKKIKEVIDVTKKLFCYAQTSINHIQDLSPRFDVENKEDIIAFQKTAILVKALIDIVQIPLFDKNGALSVNGINILESSYRIIENQDLSRYEEKN